MKYYKLILTSTIICFVAISLKAQVVGIGTATPTTNLVLDIKGNNSSASEGDRIVIDNEGNVGVGTITPIAKLDIKKNGNNSPLRIVDGKVAANKIMGCDDDGRIIWVDEPNPQGKNFNITGTKRKFTTQYTLVKAFSVPNTGLYQFVLRWWGRSQSYNKNKSTAAIFYLATSNSNANNWAVDQHAVKDQKEQYIMGVASNPNETTFCFTLPLTAYAIKGSFLKLYIKVSVGGPWTIGDVNVDKVTWNPSVAMFKI